MQDKNKIVSENQDQSSIERKIFSNGEDITQRYQFVSLTAHREVNRISSAILVVQDGERAISDFEASNQPEFVPGATITIELGYDTNTTQIFTGIVVNHGISVRRGKVSVLKVELKDEAIRMTINRKNKIHKGTDAKVIKSIVNSSEYKNLTFSDKIKRKGGADISDSTLEPIIEAEHKNLVQYNVTDWDFIVSRADATGRLIFNVDGEVRLAQPVVKGDNALGNAVRSGLDNVQEGADAGSAVASTIGAADTEAGGILATGVQVASNGAKVVEAILDKDIVSVEYGHNLIEFEADIDARYQYKNVVAYSWDYSKQKRVKAKSSKLTKEKFQTQGNLSPEDIASQVYNNDMEIYQSGRVVVPELQSWANSKLQRSRLARVRGRVSLQGTSNIYPGDTINLKGVGDRFNGRAFVSAVRHDVYEGDWITEVQFGLSPEWFAKEMKDVVDISVSGLLPAIEGLHLGIVTSLSGDPDKQGRILIKVPIISETEGAIWARLAKEYAGASYGNHFGPEVDDEVIVGFINNDPRQAIVLGSVHSSENASPFQIDDNNYQKGIITKSEMKMIFDDDQKSLIISTPDKKTVTISDADDEISIEDQHSNKIVMSSDGIEITSKGSIKLDATKNIELKSNGDIKMDGTGVKASGKTMNLESNGPNTISGTPIKLN